MTLLVVDDDSDQLWIRCMLLRQNGFDTLKATDPESAMRIASESKPPVAILDLRLPTEDAGLRLIRDLKTLDPAMLVFVLTGGDPAKLNAYPERSLIEEVVVKGSPSARLVGLLRQCHQPGHRAGVRSTDV